MSSAISEACHNLVRTRLQQWHQDFNQLSPAGLETLIDRIGNVMGLKVEDHISLKDYINTCIQLPTTADRVASKIVHFLDYEMA